MFIEFPEHDKLINVSGIDRIEIQTTRNNNSDEIYKLVLYFDNDNNHRNHNDMRKFVVFKSLDKNHLYAVWRDIVRALRDEVVTVHIPTPR